MIGDGDAISASALEMWSDLVRMKEHAAVYGGDIDAGLDLCDFIAGHLSLITDPVQYTIRERSIIEAGSETIKSIVVGVGEPPQCCRQSADSPLIHQVPPLCRIQIV